MNKKIILFLMFFVLSSFVLASECNPSSWADYCEEHEEISDLGLAVDVKLQSTQLWTYEINNVDYATTNPEYDITAYCDGTKFYLYDYNDVQSPECGRSGCNGAVVSLKTNDKIKISLNNYAPIRPYLVCYKYETFSSNIGTPINDWVWATTGLVYETDLKKSLLECTSSSQCGGAEYCEIANFRDKQCLPLNCGDGELIENHKCVAQNIPEYCTNNDITDFNECYDYLLEYLPLLQSNLNEVNDDIIQMELDLDAALLLQETYYNRYLDLEEELGIKIDLVLAKEKEIELQRDILLRTNATLNKKIEAVNTLNVSLQTTIELLEQYELNNTELASELTELELSNENLNTAIDELTTNNQDRLELYVELQKKYEELGIVNEKFLDLMKEANLLTSEIGSILNEIDATIDEDAETIVYMAETDEDIVEILASMKSRTEVMLDIIKAMDEENELSKKTIADLWILVDESAKQNQELMDSLEREKQINAEIQEALDNRGSSLLSLTFQNTILISVVVVLFLIIIIGGIVISRK